MPTETLRPNATIKDDNLSVTGAASAHAALSDDSDSSYALQTDNGADDAEMGLGTFSLPAGARIKEARARARCRSVDSGGDAIGVQLLDPDGGVVAEIPYETPITSTITTYAGAWTAATLSQSDIDGLTLAFRSQIQADSVRFMELYADVVYATQPTATITTPTGDPTYTGTNKPTIEWTYAQGSDGGAQSRFEVKVFTQTQVAAGGFDADTTTPVHTSGEVLGSATSHIIADPLDTGEDYEAFVRVAQSINGVPHWSDWDDEEFTLNVSTADVDTVTATATDATASIEVTVARDGTSEAWDAVEVQRSVDGGDWEPVRGADGVDATGDANSFVVDDYEVPNGVATHYRARATRIVSDLPITGAWVETTSSAKWESGDWWIKDPEDSSKNTTFTVSNGAPWTTTRRQGVHQVLGARRPIVTSDTRSDPRFPLVVLTLDGDEEDALDALTRSSVVLIQSPTSRWGARYAVILGDVAMGWPGDESDSLRVWPLSCVEVAAPADPLAGSGLP